MQGSIFASCDPLATTGTGLVTLKESVKFIGHGDGARQGGYQGISLRISWGLTPGAQGKCTRAQCLCTLPDRRVSREPASVLAAQIDLSTQRGWITMAEAFLDTVFGKRILFAALDALKLGVYADAAQKVLDVLRAESMIADRANREEYMDAHPIAVGQTAVPVPLMEVESPTAFVPSPLALHMGKRRRAYSALSNRLPANGSLTPAQQKILATLTRASKPLDVGELTQSCGLQKKTVTNGLSVLKSKQMVAAHDKR